MTKCHPFVFLFFLPVFSFSQSINFQKVFPAPPGAQIENPFSGVQSGDFAMGDVNGDSLPDIFIIGENDEFQTIAELYINEGGGNYRQDNLGSVFQSLNKAHTNFADLDGDGDLDLLTIGQASSSVPMALVYLNNGQGTFSSGTPRGLLAIFDGTSAIADVDGDGDLDLYLAGQKFTAPNYFSSLYLNNGTGNFTAAAAQSFTGVRRGAAKFADVDGDGDVDLVQSGNSISNPFYVTELYLNNGSGVFTLSTTNTFTGASESTIEIFDADNDNDLDLFVSGTILGLNTHSQLYKNNGLGIFTAVSSGLMAYKKSYSSAGDIDGDGDIDLFLGGSDPANFQSADLFLNDGTGSFSPQATTLFSLLDLGSAQMTDVDGDADLDLFTTGNLFFNFRGAMLYINSGNGTFYEAGGSSFVPVYDGAMAYGDVNSDGSIDLWVTGSNKSLGRSSQLYSASGTGLSALASNLPLLNSAAAQFADLDNDNDSDLVVFGLDTALANIGAVYLNNGSGGFSLSANSGLLALRDGAVVVADFDGDGDADVVNNGQTSPMQVFTRYYKNNGSAVFSEVANSNLINLSNGSLIAGDVDNDGDLDLYLTGQQGTSNFQSKLYLNTAGNFSAAVSTFTGIRFSSVAFADIDQDGDLDLIQSGQASSGLVTEVYLNDGTGAYLIDNSNSLAGLFLGAMVCADFNGDSYPDLIYNGLDFNDAKFTYIYENDGSGLFLNQSHDLRELAYGDMAYFDANNDTVFELYVSGVNNSGQPVAYQYNSFPCTIATEVIDSLQACQSYTWNDSVFFSSDTNATMILKSSLGCDSLVRLFLELTTIDTQVVILPGGVELHSADTSARYQWLDCTNGYGILVGDTLASFKALQNGLYAVQLTKGHCVDTSACVAISSVGLRAEEGGQIQVYPNPSAGRFKIQINGNVAQTNIQIFKSTGQELPFQIEQQDVKSLHIRVEAQPGYYLLQVENEEGIYVKPLLIK